MGEFLKNSIWMDLNGYLNQRISKAFKRWIDNIASFSHMVKVRQIEIKLVCSRLCKLVSPRARNSHSPPSCFILYPLPIYRSTWSVLWNIKGERGFTPIRLLDSEVIFLDSWIAQKGTVLAIIVYCWTHTFQHLTIYFYGGKIYKYFFCSYEKLVNHKIILHSISRNQVTVGLILEVICVQNSCAL